MFLFFFFISYSFCFLLEAEIGALPYLLLCDGGKLFHHLEKHGRFFESKALVLFSHLMQVVILS
uniref:Secreted protein n=1 Tax=Nelumbo nucifera TaxID=4432 RepID=A0A822YUI2_NELNU|nr:TPA_asm: hypothetical protein HUJ06_008394 [Nelumbo nucifera]